MHTLTTVRKKRELVVTSLSEFFPEFYTFSRLQLTKYAKQNWEAEWCRNSVFEGPYLF